LTYSTARRTVQMSNNTEMMEIKTVAIIGLGALGILLRRTLQLQFEQEGR
jgi:lactate dehydrogenase-like 2-hydroxyacid dehydrogenase